MKGVRPSHRRAGRAQRSARGTPSAASHRPQHPDCPQTRNPPRATTREPRCETLLHRDTLPTKPVHLLRTLPPNRTGGLASANINMQRLSLSLPLEPEDDERPPLDLTEEGCGGDPSTSPNPFPLPCALLVQVLAYLHRYRDLARVHLVRPPSHPCRRWYRRAPTCSVVRLSLRVRNSVCGTRVHEQGLWWWCLQPLEGDAVPHGKEWTRSAVRVLQPGVRYRPSRSAPSHSHRVHVARWTPSCPSVVISSTSQRIRWREGIHRPRQQHPTLLTCAHHHHHH